MLFPDHRLDLDFEKDQEVSQYLRQHLTCDELTEFDHGRTTEVLQWQRVVEARAYHEGCVATARTRNRNGAGTPELQPCQTALTLCFELPITADPMTCNVMEVPKSRGLALCLVALQ